MDSEGRRNNRADNSRAGFEKREKRRTIRGLQEAIDNNDVETVKQILTGDFDVDFQYRSQTALQLAVKQGCHEICKLLIKKGANVNMADAELNNLLNMACWRGYLDIAKLLVDNNAGIDDRNIHGSTPLNTCAFRGYTDILLLLLQAKCNPDLPNDHGLTPLHTATKLCNKEIVQMLILGGCDVNKMDFERRTPLMMAAELGYCDIARLLLKGVDSSLEDKQGGGGSNFQDKWRGADPNLQDKRGATACFEAASMGHVEVLNELICAKADLNLPITKGTSPLLESIYTNHLDVALRLIQGGCNVDQTDRCNQAPIHAAVALVSKYFNEEKATMMSLIRALVEAGCDLNVGDQLGERPLYQSVCGGDHELTKYLLDRKADPTVITNKGEGILHAGVYGNNSDLMELLLKAGCPINVVNERGEHPLMTAVLNHSDIKIVRSLIEAGSDLNLQCKQAHNMTTLHRAILHYYSEAALLLIDSGCDINIRNDNDQTALYIACEKGNDEIVKRLLEHPKCSLKITRTSAIPLHAAVVSGHPRIVQMLVDAGCDINLIDVEGLTPVQHATEEHNFHIAKLLLKYNCDLNFHHHIKRLYRCCLKQEDQHPHFCLEPLFLALTHKDVDLIRLFINCYYTLPTNTIKMLTDVFRSTPEMSEHFSPQLKEEILNALRNATKHTRKLQEICRGAVRQILGQGIHLKVEQLPLAIRLKSYVLMDEYFGSLDSVIEEMELSHPFTLGAFRSVHDEEEGQG
ncbi:hypothetical protein ACJMK2_035186 [Sinanodonta woodiana]|uniref:SOCS box domain-containing protein n=1 Tax=Sinanodonta woodiana TaxID=1069815 RepID=A0ABD3WVK0_SINWO